MGKARGSWRALRQLAIVCGMALLICGAWLALPAAPVRAASFTVTTTSDNAADPSTLRYALLHLAAGGNTINFAIVATGTTQTITLGSPLPAITQDVTIDGLSQGGAGYTGPTLMTVDGNSTGTVFTVNSGVTVTISGLTIQHGSGTPGSCFGSNTCGGGILNRGTLTVTNATIANSSAPNSGGGIYSNGGTLTVTNSTFSGNAADTGAAIASVGGTVTVTSSIFASSSARVGGGIYINGGTLTVTNSTFSGNSASLNGGGILIVGGATGILTNTIVANSTNGGDLSADGLSTFTGTNNLIGDGSGGLSTANGNKLGTAVSSLNPLLGTLGTYGGGTQTLPLLPGSPAINAGTAVGSGPSGPSPPANTVPASDQRGMNRVGVPDIGAFESQGFTMVKTSGDGQSATVTTAFANPLVVTLAANNAGEPVQGGVISVTGPGSGAGIQPNPTTGTIGAGGQASIAVTANATAGGPYTVTASTAGSPSVTFSLTNVALLPEVNSTADGAVNVANCAPNNANTCRLRDAIAAVNERATTGTTITFDAAVFPVGGAMQTITLGPAGALNLTLTTAPVTITGPGALALAVDGGCTQDGTGHCVSGGTTVFVVQSGVTATLTGLTIQHGMGPTYPPCSAGPACGSGIYTTGTLTVTDSTIADNFVFPAAKGGGIDNVGGTLTVLRSMFARNYANSGGGIANENGTLVVSNCTFSDNLAPSSGGGIYGHGGTLTITSSTLSGNQGTIGGGAIDVGSGTLTAINTLMSGSRLNPMSADVSGTFAPGSTNNLISDGTGASGIANGVNGNIVGTPTAPVIPLLGPLGLYGGPTPTLPLLPGSPALDAGAAVGSGPAGNTVPATDQRGKSRFNAPDIGAFESQGFTLSTVSGDNQSTAVNTAFANPLVVAVTAKNAAEPVQGGAITFTGPASGAGIQPSPHTGTIGANGQASVTVTANGTKGTYTVTASAASANSATFSLTNTALLVSITVTPANGTLKPRQTQQFTATGTYADNSTADLTNQVTWSSDAPTVTSVNAMGLGTGASPGTAHVTAMQGNVSGQATVTVSGGTSVGVAPVPAPASRPGSAGTTPPPGGASPPTPNPAPTGR